MMFSMRIVTTDSAMLEPIPGLDMTYSEFRANKIYKVPVIRICGATAAGQKACMSIHGVFPYLYAPYDGSTPVDSFLQQLAASIDKAVNVAHGKAMSPAQHVYKISLVSGIPFYGYHEEERPFLKIYLYNPMMIKKVCDLLIGGAIMNRIMQPHEAHIPYTLQMFIDYNLFGMNLIHARAVRFRQPVPMPKSNTEQPGDDTILERQTHTASACSHSSSNFCSGTGTMGGMRLSQAARTYWTSNNIPEDLVLSDDVKRSSRCELEVDVIAADILNRLATTSSAGLSSNPGLRALWEDERQRRTERELPVDDIAPPSSPDRTDAVVWTDAEFPLQQKLQDLLVHVQPRQDDVLKLSAAGSEHYGQSTVPVDSSQPHSTSGSGTSGHAHSRRSSTDIFQDPSSPPDDRPLVEDCMEQHSVDFPLVDELAIQQVVLSSQSFARRYSSSRSQASNGSGRHDNDDLAQVLATLAADSSYINDLTQATPPCRQPVTGQSECGNTSSSVEYTTPLLPTGYLCPINNPEKADEDFTILQMSNSSSKRLSRHDVTMTSRHDTSALSQHDFDMCNGGDILSCSSRNKDDVEMSQNDHGSNPVSCSKSVTSQLSTHISSFSDASQRSRTTTSQLDKSSVALFFERLEEYEERDSVLSCAVADSTEEDEDELICDYVEEVGERKGSGEGERNERVEGEEEGVVEGDWEERGGGLISGQGGKLHEGNGGRLGEGVGTMKGKEGRLEKEEGSLITRFEEEYDMDGMDRSWNMNSQLLSPGKNAACDDKFEEEVDQADEDPVVQLDGPNDRHQRNAGVGRLSSKRRSNAQPDITTTCSTTFAASTANTATSTGAASNYLAEPVAGRTISVATVAATRLSTTTVATGIRTRATTTAECKTLSATVVATPRILLTPVATSANNAATTTLRSAAFETKTKTTPAIATCLATVATEPETQTAVVTSTVTDSQTLVVASCTSTSPSKSKQTRWLRKRRKLSDNRLDDVAIDEVNEVDNAIQFTRIKQMRTSVNLSEPVSKVAHCMLIGDNSGSSDAAKSYKVSRNESEAKGHGYSNVMCLAEAVNCCNISSMRIGRRSKTLGIRRHAVARVASEPVVSTALDSVSAPVDGSLTTITSAITATVLDENFNSDLGDVQFPVTECCINRINRNQSNSRNRPDFVQERSSIFNRNLRKNRKATKIHINKNQGSDNYCAKFNLKDMRVMLSRIDEIMPVIKYQQDAVRNNNRDNLLEQIPMVDKGRNVKTDVAYNTQPSKLSSANCSRTAEDEIVFSQVSDSTIILQGTQDKIEYNNDDLCLNNDSLCGNSGERRCTDNFDTRDNYFNAPLDENRLEDGDFGVDVMYKLAFLSSPEASDSERISQPVASSPTVCSPLSGDPLSVATAVHSLESYSVPVIAAAPSLESYSIPSSSSSSPSILSPVAEMQSGKGNVSSCTTTTIMPSGLLHETAVCSSDNISTSCHDCKLDSVHTTDADVSSMAKEALLTEILPVNNLNKSFRGAIKLRTNDTAEENTLPSVPCQVASHSRMNDSFSGATASQNSDKANLSLTIGGTEVYSAPYQVASSSRSSEQLIDDKTSERLDIDSTRDTVILRCRLLPPLRRDVVDDMKKDHIGLVAAVEAFCSDPKDVSTHKFKDGPLVKSPLVQDLPRLHSRGLHQINLHELLRLAASHELASIAQSQTSVSHLSEAPLSSLCGMLSGDSPIIITPCRKPPSVAEVRKLLVERCRNADSQTTSGKTMVSDKAVLEKEKNLLQPYVVPNLLVSGKADVGQTAFQEDNRHSSSQKNAWPKDLLKSLDNDEDDNESQEEFNHKNKGKAVIGRKNLSKNRTKVVLSVELQAESSILATANKSRDADKVLLCDNSEQNSKNTRPQHSECFQNNISEDCASISKAIDVNSRNDDTKESNDTAIDNNKAHKTPFSKNEIALNRTLSISTENFSQSDVTECSRLTPASRTRGLRSASMVELEIPGGIPDCNDTLVSCTAIGQSPLSGGKDIVSSTPVGERYSDDVDNRIYSCTPILSRISAETLEDTDRLPAAGDKEKDSKCDDTRQRRHVLSTPLRSGTEMLSLRKLRKKQIKSTTKTDPGVTGVLTQKFSAIPAARDDLTISGIEGPTLKNSFGFRVESQNLENAKSTHDCQYLTVLSVELHVSSRGDLRPDPEVDSIRALFFSVHHDKPTSAGSVERISGIIVVDAVSLVRSAGQSLLQVCARTMSNVSCVETELRLIDELVELVLRLDVDILVGYEIEKLSWGYLVQRAAHLSIDLVAKLSRLTDTSRASRFAVDKTDTDEVEYESELHVPGRIILNLWRLIRHEVTLNIYTFENVFYHVLHERTPLYSFKSLTAWFDSKTHLHSIVLILDRWRTVDFYVLRADANLRLISQLDLIGQTSEFARVFGIEFYQVLSRGSQFRVESMMLRLAKPSNYIAVTPSVQQRAKMRAPECIQLMLEPRSAFHCHPVVVLDFQSLYPSIMIAYNYCFSTCLGRLQHLAKNSDPFAFGCTSLSIPPAQLKALANDVTICPNGVVFVKSHIRKGTLSRMVEEILETRLMVKRAMKLHKNDTALQRLLHARQLSLKLIANVTFGYTAANFSGRMPCVEVGDSILRKSRETLERAIRLVETTGKWGAEVIYGDTDSMFVLLKGRTKEEAFLIGQEIADAVTADNPKPVKLKLEKVYLPCILQTKKRYVGFMYESSDQKEPTFDAKGIETVRRDSCSAVSKILEKSLKLLFTSRDVSQVRRYVQRQFVKMLEGRSSVQDCVFAKEYRGMAGYQPRACVPALELARRALSKDRRAEPLVKERVPYVIVHGSPGLPLIQLVRTPQELLHDPNLRLNVTYYITKQILPVLSRAFSLAGVDVLSWYVDLPRVLRGDVVPTAESGTGGGGKGRGTISRYFVSLNCPVCEELTNTGMCSECRMDRQRVAVILNGRVRDAERNHAQLGMLCTSCMGCVDSTLPCTSLDCPVLYRLNRASRQLTLVPNLHTQINLLLQQF